MEQKFHKDDQVRYAYKEADAVRLRAQGWVEGKAPKPSPEPEPETKSEKDKGRDS